MVLLLTAILGKIIGTSLPALLTVDWKSSTLLGISMVPRAEIAMIIMQQGQQLGSWAVPEKVFGAMAIVSLATCLISPLVLHPLFQKWPRTRT